VKKSTLYFDYKRSKFFTYIKFYFPLKIRDYDLNHICIHFLPLLLLHNIINAMNNITQLENFALKLRPSKKNVKF
jgi:hypothetical protein